MSESWDENDLSHYTIDDWIDKLDRLPGDFYELRNALNMAGNPVLAKRMDEFASQVRTPIVRIRVLLHRERMTRGYREIKE